MQAQYEIISPIHDDLLVESVALAIFRSHIDFDHLHWQKDCSDFFRCEVRAEARAAIATVFEYLIRLEGASHGDQ